MLLERIESDCRMESSPCDNDNLAMALMGKRVLTKSEIISVLNGSIVTLVQRALLGHNIAKIVGTVDIFLSESSDKFHIDINEIFSEPYCGDDFTKTDSDPLTEQDTLMSKRLDSKSTSFGLHDQNDEELELSHSQKVPSIVEDLERGLTPETNFLEVPIVRSVSQDSNFLEVPISESKLRRSSWMSDASSQPASPCSDLESGYAGSVIGGDQLSLGSPGTSELLSPSHSDAPSPTGNAFSYSPAPTEVKDSEMLEKNESDSVHLIDENEDGRFNIPLIIDLEEPRGTTVDETQSTGENEMDVEGTVHGIGLTEGVREDGQEHFADDDDDVEGQDRREQNLTQMLEDKHCKDIPEVPYHCSDQENSDKCTASTTHQQSIADAHKEGHLCKQCHAVLPSPSDVARHALKSHGLHACDICCRVFTAKNNLNRHVRLHTGIKPYSCNKCPMTFSRRDDLKGHMLRHSYNKPFRCSLCKKGYTDRACVKNHMMKEHGANLKCVCPKCGESFHSNVDFENHKTTHPELQQYSCNECSFIGTNIMMSLKHGLFHKGKVYTCKPCKEVFDDPFLYTHHLKGHKMNRAFVDYVCCFCDLTLPSYEKFIRHEYSHVQIKPYPCKICNKQFKCKSTLKDHYLTHFDFQNTADPAIQESDKEKGSKIICNAAARTLHSTNPKQYPVADVPAYDSHRDQATSHGRDLLNLSLKSPNHHVYEPQEVEALDLSQKPELISSSVPRNGSTFESSGFQQRSGDSELLRRSDIREKTFSTVFGVPDTLSENSEHKTFFNRQSSLIQPEENLNAKRKLYANENRSFSVSTDSEMDDSGSKQCQKISRQNSDSKIILQNSRNDSNRFSPYTREKMAKFASKFAIARANQLSQVLSQLPSTPAIKQNNDIPTVITENEPREITIWDCAEKLVTACNEDTSLQLQEKPEVAKLKNLLIKKINGSEKHPRLKKQETIDNISPVISMPERGLEAQNYHSFNTCSTETSTFPQTFLQSGPTASPNSSITQNTGAKSSHRCPCCIMQFSSFQELESHCIAEHKRYLCDHCEKSFTSRPNRDRHVRYHTGVRPYKCDLCEAAFFRGDDLKYHRTTRHPTARPFTCAQCNASFAWEKDLERHMRHSKCV